jgi:hypothetical protein
MPRIFYHLYRPKTKKQASTLKSIEYHATELLPDALVKSYQGKVSDMMHLPLLDTKCISE